MTKIKLYQLLLLCLSSSSTGSASPVLNTYKTRPRVRCQVVMAGETIRAGKMADDSDGLSNYIFVNQITQLRKQELVEVSRILRNIFLQIKDIKCAKSNKFSFLFRLQYRQWPVLPSTSRCRALWCTYIHMCIHTYIQVEGT